MTARERILKMFGSWERVPTYLRRALGLREEAQRRSAEKMLEAERKEEAERARIKALRRPPRNVRLKGRRVTWEPPETADELPPAGYWVSECYKGSWTKHGDYVLPHVREAVLFGEGPASVETWYHQMALGESYSAPAMPVRNPGMADLQASGGLVEAQEAAADQALVATVRGYLSERTGRPPAYYERWTRALAGLGAAEHADPMAAAEAQGYADRGWRRWAPVAEALRRIEGVRG